MGRSRATLPGLIGSYGRGESRPLGVEGGVEIIGLDRTVQVLRDLQGRFVSQTGWLSRVAIPTLEAGEMAIFDAWSPHFNSATSGAWPKSSGSKYGTKAPSQLKNSLTEPAAPGTWSSFGAVRWVGDHALIFGTSIFYARYQRAIGGPSGKPRGRKRVGPSLVLALNAEELDTILDLAEQYFFGPLVDLEGEEVMVGPATFAGAE